MFKKQFLEGKWLHSFYIWIISNGLSKLGQPCQGRAKKIPSMIFFLKRNYDQLRKRKAIISVSFIYGITYIAINNKDILIISTTVGMQVPLQ